MKKILLAGLILTLGTCSVVAQKADPPFYALDAQVKKTRGGWDGSHDELSSALNAERIRLGDRFEPEVLKYLGTEIDKHDWIASFLETREYLHGAKPLPQLALLIRQQGIALLQGRTDQETLGAKMKLSVLASVLSEKMGLHPLAEVYKRDAESVLASDADFGAWFPAMGGYDRCLYDSLNQQARLPCKAGNEESSPKGIRGPIHAGILNGKALSLPRPVYSAEARAKRLSGTVEIEVLVDEMGQVESVRGLKGDPLLISAALESARRARFSPTTLEGQPVKLEGRLIYHFEWR